MNIQTVIAIIITLVWAINYTAPLFIRGYTPPIEINPPLILVAGFFFGSGLKKALKNGDSDKTK